MKQILKIICKILWKICKSWPDWKKHFMEDLVELEEKISSLPDDELEEKLSDEEKAYLRGNREAILKKLKDKK